MDYYFQDQLRWSFGFDNPNKAAALLASLVPLLWIAYRTGWLIKQKWARWAAVAFGGAIVCAGWWCLFKTYSRGGIIAAVAGSLYLGVRCWNVGNENQRWKIRAATLLLGLIVAGMFVSTNAAQRSTQWVTQREGSVENRYELWKGGLQMIAQIPQGVGRGNSGEIYMQWFQPVESTPRYRTLVNSYLTFVAEQGLAISGLVLFVISAGWFLTSLGSAGPGPLIWSAGLRASLLAFAVAGVFSTTMEEPRLWIVPGLCAGALILIAAAVRRGAGMTRCIASAAAVTCLLCAGVWFAGWILARPNAVRITASAGRVEITPLGRETTGRLQVLLDRSVLGNNYGKLVRRLAAQTGFQISFFEEETSPAEGEMVLAAGETVQTLKPVSYKTLLLLVPAEIEFAPAQDLLKTQDQAIVLTSGFDEDGRSGFWKDVVAEVNLPDRVRHHVLEGVGTQVEWAWGQVEECLRQMSSPGEKVTGQGRAISALGQGDLVPVRPLAR